MTALLYAYRKVCTHIRLPNNFCKNKNQSKRKENDVTKFRHRKALNKMMLLNLDTERH